MLIYVKAESLLLVHDGAAFRPPVTRTERLGVNADASDERRLTVASDATLLTHESEDHRLTINKANAAASASLVFQDDSSGRAEIGLAGSDALSFVTDAAGGAALAFCDGTEWRRISDEPLI